MTSVIFERNPDRKGEITFHLGLQISRRANGDYLSVQADWSDLTKTGHAILNALQEIPGLGIPFFDGHSITFLPARAYDLAEMIWATVQAIQKECSDELELSMTKVAGGPLLSVRPTREDVQRHVRDLPPALIMSGNFPRA